MDKIMSDKERLIAHLEILRDAEESKPVNEKDNELIRACIVLLLDLQGKKLTLTEEEIEERVRNFPFVAENKGIDNQKNTEGKNKKVSKKKVLLVAACIAILVALFSIASIAFKWNIFEELKNRFGTVADTPVGVQYEFDGVSVIRPEKIETYKSIDKAIDSETLDILLPDYLPKDIFVQNICVYQENSFEEVNIVFNNSDLYFFVKMNSDISIEVIDDADETKIINDKQCYIKNLSDIGVCQVYFQHNHNVYKLEYTNMEELIKLIENLKE